MNVVESVATGVVQIPAQSAEALRGQGNGGSARMAVFALPRAQFLKALRPLSIAVRTFIDDLQVHGNLPLTQWMCWR